jgi:hypothetical protein
MVRSLCLITSHCAVNTWGSGSIASPFLDFGNRWRWGVSFTLLPLYPRGKSPYGIESWLIQWTKNWLIRVLSESYTVWKIFTKKVTFESFTLQLHQFRSKCFKLYSSVKRTYSSVIIYLFILQIVDMTFCKIRYFFKIKYPHLFIWFYVTNILLLSSREIRDVCMIIYDLELLGTKPFFIHLERLRKFSIISDDNSRYRRFFILFLLPWRIRLSGLFPFRINQFWN